MGTAIQNIPIVAVVTQERKLWRNLTRYEEAAKVDFLELERQFEEHVKSTTSGMAGEIENIQTSIIEQVRRLKILENRDMKRIKDVIIAPRKLQDGVKHIRNICLNAFAYVYLEGRSAGLQEVENSLGKKVIFQEQSGPLAFVLQDQGYDILNGMDHNRAHFAGISDMTPKEALDRFRRRVPMTKRQYSQLLDMAKGRAFTVAGIIEKDMLRVLQELLYKAIREGAPLEDFAHALKKANIKYTGSVYGTEQKKGQPISPIHTETIVRTNFASVYSDGRWDMFNDPAVVSFVPAYQYSAILDQRTRETHRKMDKKVYARDDPIWKRWRPPAGFNCRCLLTPITANMEYVISAPTSLQPDPGFGALAA